MEYDFDYRGKRIFLNVKKCNFLQKIIGLMFKRKNKAKALLFELKKPIAIHSCFVFFPFIAIWLKDNKIVDIRKISPFTLHIKPKKYFNKIIEIPINNNYKKVLEKLRR